MGKSTISMVIFNSYVKLPEGNNKHRTWFCFWEVFHNFQADSCENGKTKPGEFSPSRNGIYFLVI